MMVRAGLKPPLVTWTLRVDHEEVGRLVDAAITIHDRGLGVVAHATRARLVLAAGEPGPGAARMDLARAGLAQPRRRLLRLMVADVEGLLMPASGEPQHRDAPVVPRLRVELHAGVPDRDLLSRSDHHDVAPVVAPHEVLVLPPPSRRARRREAHELDRQPDELVRQHPAAGQPAVAVVVVADRDAGAGTDVVEGLLLEEADGAGVGVALQVAAHPVVAVADPARESCGSSREGAGAPTRWLRRRAPRDRPAAPGDGRLRRSTPRPSRARGRRPGSPSRRTAGELGSGRSRGPAGSRCCGCRSWPPSRSRSRRTIESACRPSGRCRERC